MPNVALIPDSETRIDALTAVVDGYPSGVHRLETTTGGEPLEDGREATDHAVATQDRLTLEGWVSDFSGGDRPRRAWETLRRLHRKLEPLTVFTEWTKYDRMLIVRCEANQDSRGLRFTLELKQLILVGITDTELPPDSVSGPAQGRSGVVERGRVALPSI